MDSEIECHVTEILNLLNNISIVIIIIIINFLIVSYVRTFFFNFIVIIQLDM